VYAVNGMLLSEKTERFCFCRQENWKKGFLERFSLFKEHPFKVGLQR
jgi:hypothetical protein